MQKLISILLVMVSVCAHAQTVVSPLSLGDSSALSGTHYSIVINGTSLKKATVNQLKTAIDTDTHYVAGSGLSLTGTTFAVTISDTDTRYVAGTGVTLTGTTFSLTNPPAAGTGIVITNGTISATGGSGSGYVAGSGLTLTGTTFSLTTPIAAGYNATVTNGTIASTGSALSIFPINAYGALSGTTINTTAIQAAINAAAAAGGGKVWIPVGDWRAIGLTSSNRFVSFEGADAGGSRLFASATGTLLTITGTADLSTITDFERIQSPAVANLTLDGTGAGTKGLVIRDTHTPLVHNVSAYHFTDVGIEQRAVVGGWLQNCRAIENAVGFRLTNTTSALYGGNNFPVNIPTIIGGGCYGNTTLAIEFRGGYGLTLDQVNLESNGTDNNAATGGIYISSSFSTFPGRGIMMRNCWVEDTRGGFNLKIDGAPYRQRHSIENCWFLDYNSGVLDANIVLSGTGAAKNILRITESMANSGLAANVHGTGSNAELLIDSSDLTTSGTFGAVRTAVAYLESDSAIQTYTGSTWTTITTGSSTTFDPTTLTGFYVWLKDEDLGLSNSDPVPEITDTSGNGIDAVQASGTKQPTYLTAGGPGGSASAVQFDGADNSMGTNAAVDLSGSTKAWFSFWLYWDSYGSDDDLVMEHSADVNSNHGILMDPNNSGGSTFLMGVRGDVGFNVFEFARPSAAAWHHYAVNVDTSAAAAGEMEVYVDGVSVSLTNTPANNTANLANAALYLFSRNNASLFGAGRLHNLIIGRGHNLTSGEVTSLYTLQ